ncbi:MAG: 1-deoxy-D-xylulose-5-phosphate synthase [Lachnospiraceae bacterium]|nr:1-deoxy-D-xylulose-5-phosphate synthase [Lachnospiraceae bacterium]
MGKYLEQINRPNDIKKIPAEHYKELAQEIRDFLIQNISETGGHLASNLGAVELTMGLHLALNLPEDQIVWDVGHQSYTHKILTGRKDQFPTLRKFGGLSGFPKRSESACDVFDTGHASTSISAGLGLARARDLAGEKRTIVAVIGDGALTGGLALEAINNASKINTNFIILLNDNNHSISDNVGGLSANLNGIRSSTRYLQLRDKVYYSLNDKSPVAVNAIRRAKNTIKSLFSPGMLFEELGITYLGPVDGHDAGKVAEAIEDAKHIHKAVVVHVITQKGRGYEPAVKHPARFHGTAPFHIDTGLPKTPTNDGYTDIFSSCMVKMAGQDEKLVAITAAMLDGVGLKRFRNIYPDRFFDVGIAEEHAVTFAAGLAAGGMHPVVAIYSTFLQRAYDEIVHDVCLQDLPVVFAIDRAGIVGADGETHQGIFDLSYLSSIPNLAVMAPKNKWELADMLKFAVSYGHPAAVRYPRAAASEELEEFRAPIEYGKAEVLYREDGILLLAIGNMVTTGAKVRTLLKELGYHCSLVNARFAAPFDQKLIAELAGEHKLVVTLEENVKSGGFGEHVEAFLAEQVPGTRVLCKAVPDRFLTHGKPDELRREIGLDEESITGSIIKALS